MYGVFGGITTVFHAIVLYPVIAVVAAVAAVTAVIYEPDVPVLPLVVQEVAVQAVAAVETLVHLKGVNFSTNSSVLSPKAKQLLDENVTFASRNPTASLLLVGHCDIRGSSQLNQRLSDSRASSVKKYLIDQGVAEDRIKVSGKSYSEPMADNKTVKGLAANRRVEVKQIATENKQQ